MKLPLIGKKKEVKSYSTVLGQFRTAIDDMSEIVQREIESKADLKVKKEEIDLQINVADQEINDCQTAIQNIGDMFPGLTRTVEVEK